MLKINGNAVGVAQGDTLIFSDFEAEGDMWTGDGARQMRSHVQFPDPFVAPPKVNVSLTMWDFSNGANARADVRADEVTEEGFAIVFRTWGDTKVARARVGWIAVGPVQDDEMWDLY